MIETCSRVAPAGRSWRLLAVFGGYVVVGSAATFIAGHSPGLLTLAGIAALILAPLAVLAGLVGGYLIGIPWLLGLTDADPDDYNLAWWLPFIIVGAVMNALIYLGIAAWSRKRWHQRRRRTAISTAKPTDAGRGRASRADS